MIKFIKYHLLYLFNDIWLLLAIIMMTVSGFLFFYLGNGFDSYSLRLLEKNAYLQEFKSEAFLVCNIILSIWIIGSSKEMFVRDDAHIMLINKSKYVRSKVLAYLLYYLLISCLLYGIYQIIVVFLYGIVKFNYQFLSHLIINVTLTHLITVFISGNNKNLLLTMIYIVSYLIINLLLKTEYDFLDYFKFFIPVVGLNYPINGYLHIVLISCLIYTLSSYKHITNYE